MKTLESIENLSIQTISNLTESKVRKIFQEAKYYHSDFKPYCPKCGSFKKWNIKNKDKVITRFKCKECNNHYSITTDTIFENHKYPLKTHLLGLFLFVNSVKGISALQLARDINIGKKYAFVFLHKIRTALFNQYEELNQNKLKGTIQMDGAYISHKPKHPNKKVDRVDRRTISTINQQCIITMREVNDNPTDRSFAFIIRSENSMEIMSLVDRYIEKGSTIITDEHSAYKPLSEIGYSTKTINHSIEFQNEEGVNTNFAESYFSRLRRMIIGQHHNLSSKYMDLYVNEITYRENLREWSNKKILMNLLRHCMKCPNNTIFNGYFQRENSKIKYFKDFVR